MKEEYIRESEQGDVPPSEASVSEEEGDFEDSFLREVAHADALLRVPLPGARMGGGEGRRFEILEELGGGAMGRVFRARDVELRREVALKFLLPRSARAGQLSGSRLWEEARAIAQLDHENIVRLFDVSEWRGAPWEPNVPFLVMECLEGESLTSVLRRGRPGLRRTLEILDAVAAGLAHAHAHHIVHRDLKPSNVLLTRDGRVKLLDFGLAHLMSSSSPIVPHLPTAGTPAYMAPEQWRGGEQDARTDLWAAGVLMYEMLTGEFPYPFTSLQELRERVLSPEPVPAVRERVPELPEEVERLVAALLVKEPARRLGSASELRTWLRRLEDSLGPWRETPKFVPPQRRQVTLVSCTLVTSSSNEGWLDPEDASERHAAFHRRCADIIQRYEGAIALSIGEEMLACFGYPTAREDDSERAVRAGLQLTRAFQEESRHLDHPGLAVRVGIHTDEVVFDALSLDGQGRLPALQGEAPRVAASLSRQAGASTVLLSGTTWRLVRGAFESEPIGLPPVETYRVLRERGVASRFERALVAGGLSPLVGRDCELERLRGFWTRARDGVGACLLLSGEAGIGKSRLIQELWERVSPESSYRLRCQCWWQFRNSAFSPLIELLRCFFQFGSDALQRQKPSEVDARLMALGVPPKLWREISVLLAAPCTGDDSCLAALENQKECKRMVLDALRLLFLRMAEERPVLLVVEDLHWADPSTLELLGLLSEHISKARLLVVLSARPEFQPSWPPHLGFHPIVLDRLSSESTVALVRGLARGRSLPEETVSQLVAKTDGIPLFVEEMTRLVLEREPGGHLPPIPVTLRELLLSRLDALPPRQKALAQLCAVVGRGFSHALISQLLARDEALLQEDLAGLVSAGLLQRSWEEPGGDAYQFRHALIQEAAYQSLPRSSRRQHHRRVAQALVERFQDVVSARPEVLAHHYTEAGEYAVALPHWERAAQMAIVRSASLEALSHTQQALALLRHLPDRRAYQGDELRLLNSLGILLMDIKGYGSPEVERTYARVLELFRQMGDVVPQLELLWMGLGAYFSMTGRFDRMQELAEQLLLLGQRRKSPELIAQGYRMFSTLCFQKGELDRALDYREQVTWLMSSRSALNGVLDEKLWSTERVDDLVIQSFVYVLRIQPLESQQCMNELLALARGRGHPVNRVCALIHAAGIHQLHGDARGTLRLSEEGLGLASGIWLQPLVAGGRALRGWALTRLGRTREGLEAMRSGIDQLKELGSKAFMHYFLGLLADVYLELGRVEEGLSAVEAGLRISEETGARFFEAELHRIHGELLRADGREAEARCCLLRALAVARRQRASLFELRATLALARQPDMAHPEAAPRRLARLCGRFAPDLDVKELHEARLLLEQLREGGREGVSA
ncbi:protein kinase [Archangium violaceum]|uniref:protein kinase domain-containing protein n=1 Tax=Archangium violaceum TaxID=83451 RepID=UPI0019526543|nr:protein kinase [Archangium violaceum]QRN93704.1 protein kinase [Archangium violaceum]